MIENSNNSSDTKDVPPDAVKRAYHAPRLEDFGDLRETTWTTGTGTVNDGGAFPNAYHS